MVVHFGTRYLRIRITRPREGDLDGIELDTFAVGMTYEVSASLGTYLVATESAVVVDTDEPLVSFPQNDVRLAKFIERARDVAAESRDSKPSKPFFISKPPKVE